MPSTISMLLNSVLVAAMGALLFLLLRRRHAVTAAIYLLTRSTEAILLAVGAILLAVMGSAEGNDIAYTVAMLILGVGSVPVCYALRMDRIVPGRLAVWGMVGYALLASGALLELLGFGVGLVFSIPGGLFEVAFGLILIARGFPEAVGTSPAIQADAVNVRAQGRRMTTFSTTAHGSMRRAALVAGLSLLLMAVLADLANFGVLERLVSEGDPAVTTSNIIDALGSFRLAIIALFLVAVLDVVVAWALWIFLDQVHHAVALLAAWCRGLYAVVLAVAVSHLFAAARLVSDRQHELADTATQREVLAGMVHFDNIWSIGLGAFGIHLLLIGWLAFVSGFVPRFIGVLVAIAGAGYIIDSLGRLLSSSYGFEIASFTFVGEVVLMVWLLVFAARRSLPLADRRRDTLAKTMSSTGPESRS
jgi:hypothetical protein